MKYDLHKVDFLDISILKNTEGKITSKLFRKEAAGNTLLHADSFRPTALKKSIPFSQYLRIKCYCTTETDFQVEADALTTRILARGYTKTSLKKAFNRVTNIERHDLIFFKN